MQHPTLTQTPGQTPGEGVADRIRALLAEHGRLSVAAETIAADADLYALGLTSHASVTLMLACEDEWDVEFPQELLRKSTFASIAAMRDALASIGVPGGGVG